MEYYVIKGIIHVNVIEIIKRVLFQGHVYNSTSRIRNRKEKRSWLGFAQVTGVFPHRAHDGEGYAEDKKTINCVCVYRALCCIGT